ncbi:MULTISPECIES: hypothetical protein [Blautia]|jgi:ribosomal protein L18E|uniref:Uncharacterized protein n=1 Tax=Blautia massiliensis (ex Durand et al. 2017) TaxID=1737424 RepID=A0ABW9X7C3_9FIRM|nr:MULTISPECIES: hypothetical protein [Blautia]MZL73671.1 hypothetical protein [Blautia massiliensis (ex Durand et al. 2017)]MZL78960.1 hypothetical protein [Blautia massiliensis (ex Durand et al. 2017)]RYT32772.1 hypothetical protein EAI83_16795 [Blautia sp. aa_0143]
MNITITTIDEEQITGVEINLVKLNRMAKENKFIIYKGNILDENLTVWMLFECDGVFYLVEKD